MERDKFKGRLNGKRILITGAAPGIGAETARQLARQGACVALVGLKPERLAGVPLAEQEVGRRGRWFGNHSVVTVLIEREERSRE